jgi:hypothetical protein
MGRVGWRANVGSTQLLLDTYTGSTVSFSMFKLRKAYSGNCIRVRRSSDNTEQDFGFDGNGYLDTTSLSNFVGGQNLYTWSEDLSEIGRASCRERV